LTTEHFSISAAPPAPSAKPVYDDILALRNVMVAPQFDQRSLVYRTGETSYEEDPYAEWLIPPERMLGVGVRQWLRAGNFFRDVAEPNSYVLATRTAELQIMELCGDFRKPDEPAALLTFRFILLEPDGERPGGSGKAVLVREFSKRPRLRTRTAAAVVQALEQALNESLSELGADLARGQK
jgi:uncharacterized lipoprotein YmbA